MAQELGLDYEHRPIEIGPAGARKPEYLAINPNGRLPAIARKPTPQRRPRRPA
jgi:glutathione S-transferase